MFNTTNPHQIGTAQDPVLQQSSLGSQLKTIKQDEKNAKAPPVLPDPLEELKPLLANIFVTLSQVRNKISLAKNNPVVKQQELEELQVKVDEITTKILDLEGNLAIMSLNG